MIRTVTTIQSPATGSRHVRSRIAVAAAVLAAVLSATGAWLYGAGPVSAPEPARLNSTLYSTGSSSAIYINTLRSTSGYFVSGSWTPSNVPVGMPCSTTYPVAAGTTLYKVVYASGNYRKCQ